MIGMEQQVIYGIDIAKGSPRSRQAARYALAVLKGDSVSVHTMLGFHRIMQMIRNDRPSIIAVDNIFELAADRKALMVLLDRLPSGVKLVQVTGGMKQQPLLHLSHEHGFAFDPQNPVEEAEACARLASLGVGCEVLLFEDVTRIKVSRSRSLGRGGWSQNRYRRKVHGAVKVKSREIESILKKASRERGFEFTARAVEGFGGYVRSEFTVYARKAQVPVHPYTGSDVQVTVGSVAGDKIKYRKLRETGRKPTIVGLDPGTTVGIAILSLEGDLLYSGSHRGLSHDGIVKLVAEYGKPVVVATDVYPTPAAVEKVRRSFNAVLYSPGAEIPAEEKIALARPYNYSNDHERDSLAAAISAYRKYRNLLSKAERKIPAGVDRDRVKIRVLQGFSIGEAIDQVRDERRIGTTRPRRASESRPDDGERKNLAENLRKKLDEIEELQEYIGELKEELASRDARIGKLEQTIRRMREKDSLEIQKTKAIRIRNERIANLQKDLRRLRKVLRKTRERTNKLRQIKKLESTGKGVPVKVIASFTRSSIEKTVNMYGLKEKDVVFLNDPSGGSASTASMLADLGVRAVLVPGDVSHAAEEVFFQREIPLLDSLDIKVADDFAVVSPEALEAAIAGWAEEAGRRRQARKEEDLLHLVDEYRSERRRGIS
jgi:hypothetical protein